MIGDAVEGCKVQAPGCGSTEVAGVLSCEFCKGSKDKKSKEDTHTRQDTAEFLCIFFGKVLYLCIYLSVAMKVHTEYYKISLQNQQTWDNSTMKEYVLSNILLIDAGISALIRID